MIIREKELKLIAMYLYICELYDKELKLYCQRYSNNSNPAFTDQEIMTIYLFARYCQKYFLIIYFKNLPKDRNPHLTPPEKSTYNVAK